MSCRKHVVITGTGRAGTTFLVELLTALGMDTGYEVDDLPTRKSTIARAGLEHDIRHDDSPYIVKSPFFCDYADEVLARPDIRVDRIFVPIRDLYAAAESRRQVEQSTMSAMSVLRRIRRRFKRKALPGGLWSVASGDADDQERVLLEKLYRLMLGVSGHLVPTTFLRYPLLVEDSTYLLEKLRPILTGMSHDQFRTAHQKIARRELVHDFALPRV